MSESLTAAAIWLALLGGFSWGLALPVKKFIPYRSWIVLFSGSGISLLAIIIILNDSALQGAGLHWLWWTVLSVVFAAIEAMAAWRFYDLERLRQAREDMKKLSLKKAAMAKAQQEFEALKVELKQQEEKFQESVKFYSAARELAECADFEHMKRVLERDLKTTMPYIGGFTLYLRQGSNRAYELQIQHRLWLDREWVKSQVEPLLGQAKGPFSLDQPSGKGILIAPISFNEEIMGFFAGALNVSSKEQLSEKQDLLVYATTLAEELKFGMLKAMSFAKVQSLARVDGLTGLNRRGIFDERLAQEWLRAQTFKTTLGLLLSDIDHFKHLNDDWGHPFGDQALRQVADTLRSGVYETDTVARYGGEEFAVIFPRTNPEGAFRKAEEIRRRVERLTLYHEMKKQDVHTTISIGLAFYPQDAGNPEALIHAADEALYYAKKTGRNRVTVRAQLPPKLIQ